MQTIKFIELPRVDYKGRPMQSVYVNVEHIVAFEAEFSGGTKVTVNNFGSQGHGIVQTILSITSLVQNLGASDWGDDLRQRLHQQYQQRYSEGVDMVYEAAVADLNPTFGKAS